MLENAVIIITMDMYALLSVSKSETDSYNHKIYSVPDYFVLAILKIYPISGTINVRNLTVLNGDDYWNFFSTFSDILVMIFGVFFFFIYFFCGQVFLFL